MPKQNLANSLRVYTKVELEKIIFKGYGVLRKEQPLLLTKAFNVNERTIAAELSSIISKDIENYEVNAEYNRMTDENGVQIPKRIYLNHNDKDQSLAYPDIIIHHQKDGKHNLLVIEIKMQWKNDGKEDDLKKIKAYMNELNYSYGLYLELEEDKIKEMLWFQ